MENKRYPQSFRLFGQLWKKLFNPNSCVPDIQLDDVLVSMVSIAAETMKDDAPLIEKWALSYVAIVNASGNDVIHLWLTTSWMSIAVPTIPSYIDNGKGGCKLRNKKEMAKNEQDQINAMSKMEKTIKKLLRSKQLISVDDKLRFPS